MCSCFCSKDYFLSWALFVLVYSTSLRFSCKCKVHNGALKTKFRKALVQKPGKCNGETHQALDNAQTSGYSERHCNSICSRTVACEEAGYQWHRFTWDSSANMVSTKCGSALNVTEKDWRRPARHVLNPPINLSQQLYPPDLWSYLSLEMKHWKRDLKGATGVFPVGEKILLHGPAPLAAAQLLQQLGCAWRDIELNAKFIYFSGWTMSIYLTSITVCLSILTWALTCFLLPLPGNSRVFCSSWLGAHTAWGSWKTGDKETLLVKGGSNGSHSLGRAGV